MIEIDYEILYSPVFIILALGSLSATAIGYAWGKSQGFETYPLWQVLLVMAFEVGACYYFAGKD